jgi:hypothetical protein
MVHDKSVNLNIDGTPPNSFTYKEEFTKRMVNGDLKPANWCK